MGLQREAIESRLESLKLEAGQAKFDSKLRAFRSDSEEFPVVVLPPLPRGTRKPEPIEQVISLLEDLSRRIDGLERKERKLTDEIRLMIRLSRRRRSLSALGGLVVLSGVAVCWAMRWF